MTGSRNVKVMMALHGWGVRNGIDLNEDEDDAVLIPPISGSRALQFRIVVLLWADLLPSQFWNSDHSVDRSRLHVAMTRAEDILAILAFGRLALCL